MKLPRASMTTTLFVILVFAVAFGVARDFLLHDRATLSIYGLGFLPMATVLVFGLYRIVRLGARSDPFTVGFEVVGLVAAGSYLAVIRLVPAFRDALNDLAQTLDDKLLAVLPEVGDGDVLDLDELLVVGTMLSIPPLLVAITGGLLARRLARGADRPRGRAPIRPRFRLATISLVVAVLAVDLGLIRQVVVGPSFWTTFGIGFLPMINALVLGLPRILRNRKARFTFGFEVAGWSATAAYLAACATAPSAMMGRLVGFANATPAALDFTFGSGQAQRFFSSSFFAGLISEVGLVVAFFSLPPLVVALSGGAITRRFGRRSARTA
jgi:hypothetical protein